MFKAFPIKTQHDGVTFNGSYELIDRAKIVLVSCAYGSKSAPAGSDPKQAAIALLDEIVRDLHGRSLQP
jgi:hypothetical protein